MATRSPQFGNFSAKAPGYDCMQLLTCNRGEVSCSDEYTAAQALRLLSGPSRSELRRLWSSHTRQEIKDTRETMDSTRGTVDTPEIMEAREVVGDREIVEDALEIMEGDREIVDANREITEGTRTPSPTCC